MLCTRGPFFFFFFSSRRRHTRWPRDWSSDVCSSDLLEVVEIEDEQGETAPVAKSARAFPPERLVEVSAIAQTGQRVEIREPSRLAIAERVVECRNRTSRKI